MPLYDRNGTTNSEIGKVYDRNGTTNTEIGKVYDHNGTSMTEIWSAETVITGNTAYTTISRTDSYASDLDVNNVTSGTLGLYAGLWVGASVPSGYSKTVYISQTALPAGVLTYTLTRTQGARACTAQVGIYRNSAFTAVSSGGSVTGGYLAIKVTTGVGGLGTNEASVWRLYDCKVT